MSILDAVVDMTTAPFAAIASFRGIIRGGRGQLRRLAPVSLVPWKCDACTPSRMLGKHRLVRGVVQIVCKCNRLNTLMDPETLARMQRGELSPVELETRECAGCSRVAFEYANVEGILDVVCKCGTMNTLTAPVRERDQASISYSREPISAVVG